MKTEPVMVEIGNTTIDRNENLIHGLRVLKNHHKDEGKIFLAKTIQQRITDLKVMNIAIRSYINTLIKSHQ
ncbi:MAG TPA: hypothetical protein VJY62_02615 [Bacteroidia bacterium]|nr:hypothetical protein [Bacteroidia bacterium]